MTHLFELSREGDLAEVEGMSSYAVLLAELVVEAPVVGHVELYACLLGFLDEDVLSIALQSLDAERVDDDLQACNCL